MPPSGASAADYLTERFGDEWSLSPRAVFEPPYRQLDGSEAVVGPLAQRRYQARTTGARETSPYVNRLRMMWAAMREPVLKNFPAPPGLPKDAAAYLERVDDLYSSDAYHSLSIEGYRVSAELIELARSGNWNPDTDEDDRDSRNALAARGHAAASRLRIAMSRMLKGPRSRQRALSSSKHTCRLIPVLNCKSSR